MAFVACLVAPEGVSVVEPPVAPALPRKCWCSASSAASAATTCDWSGGVAANAALALVMAFSMETYESREVARMPSSMSNHVFSYCE